MTEIEIVRISFTLPKPLADRIDTQTKYFFKGGDPEAKRSAYLVDILERYVPQIEG